jgi:hypothetical protein
MKVFINSLVLLAVLLLVFNIAFMDFHDLLEGDSIIAFIGVAASFCAVLILLIFKLSKRIVEKMKDNA